MISAPIRSTVSHRLAQTQGSRFEFLYVRVTLKVSVNSTATLSCESLELRNDSELTNGMQICRTFCFQSPITTRPLATLQKVTKGLCGKGRGTRGCSGSGMNFVEVESQSAPLFEAPTDRQCRVSNYRQNTKAVMSHYLVRDGRDIKEI